MKHIIPVYLIVLLPVAIFSCHQPAPKQEIPQQQEAAPKQAPEPKQEITITGPVFHKVREVIKDATYTYWGNYTGHFTSALHFQDAKGAVVIEYFGGCYYTYPLKVKGDTITVYWSDRSECKGGRLALFDKATHALKPVLGKPFMLLTLANDTTLRATYLYPEWVKAVDDKQGTELFPDYFVAHQP